MRRIAVIGTALALCLLAAPVLAQNDADPVLKNLPEKAQDLVKDACGYASPDGPGDYHKCVADFSASDEIAFFAMMSPDDQTLVTTGQCRDFETGAPRAYLGCVKDKIDNAMGRPTAYQRQVAAQEAAQRAYIAAHPESVPPPPPVSLNERVGQFMGWVWDSFTGFVAANGWLIGGGLLLLVLLWWRIASVREQRRRAAMPVYQPQPHVAPDPYRSSAAMQDFKVSGAFDDGRFSSASDLDQAMRGADSHGPQPQFED